MNEEKKETIETEITYNEKSQHKFFVVYSATNLKDLTTLYLSIPEELWLRVKATDRKKYLESVIFKILTRLVNEKNEPLENIKFSYLDDGFSFAEANVKIVNVEEEKIDE